MKILRGFVQGVLVKGAADKQHAVVGISDVSLNRNGFEESTAVEFMIAGQQFKDGLHNAYRQLQGTEVFAPFTDEINTYNNKSRIRYQLQGVPLRLVDNPLSDSKPAAPVSSVKAAS